MTFPPAVEHANVADTLGRGSSPADPHSLISPRSKSHAFRAAIEGGAHHRGRHSPRATSESRPLPFWAVWGSFIPTGLSLSPSALLSSIRSGLLEARPGPTGGLRRRAPVDIMRTGSRRRIRAEGELFRTRA